MESDDLKSVKHSLPSLVELGWKEMFGATEAERLAAGRLRRSLRAAGATDDPEAYKSAVWKFELPCEADLEKSECGRATLELFTSNPPMAAEVVAKPAGTVTRVEPVPAAQVAIPQQEPTQPAPEATNEYLAKLNWPPLASQPPAKDPVDDKTVSHKWTKAEISKPDKSLRPLAPSDWNSDASKSPIY
jgi:hypothetical protein